MAVPQGRPTSGPAEPPNDLRAETRAFTHARTWRGRARDDEHPADHVTDNGNRSKEGEPLSRRRKITNVQAARSSAIDA
jgi:hypothetical protein